MFISKNPADCSPTNLSLGKYCEATTHLGGYCSSVSAHPYNKILLIIFSVIFSQENPSLFEYEQSTQQAFYYIEDATINGDILDTDDLIIAYNGDVVVGSRYWLGEITDVPAMGSDGSMAYTGYGQPGDKITFKVLDASSNTLVDMETDGETSWENFGMTVLQLTDKVIPSQISFSSAYPNPFNPVTMVGFTVPSEMEVQVLVHNMLGREVAELTNSIYGQGYYTLQWDASEQSSGVYFVTMVAGSQKNIQKLMLIK